MVRVIGSPAWARLITSRTTGSGVAGVGAHCRRCFGRAAGLHYHGSCCRSAKPDPGRAQSWGKLITESRSMADRRLGDTLARADIALRTVEALRNDVKPAVDGAVALESDAKDSWDDMYWDVKALVGSATVAARGVAETSEAVGKAAPKLAESAVGIGKSTDAIAADVHTATSDFVKPKTFWQRMKAWLETAGKVGARFL